MVIVIIGIIAGFGPPKFVNFKARAIERSEDAIMAALNTAIKAQYLKNITSGSEPENAWPCQDGNTNPFSLIEPIPPYEHRPGGWGSPIQDYYHWHTYWEAGTWGGWRIFCPHWDGTCWDSGSQTKGRYYQYKSIVTTFGNPHIQGDFWKEVDKGH